MRQYCCGILVSPEGEYTCFSGSEGEIAAVLAQEIQKPLLQCALPSISAVVHYSDRGFVYNQVNDIISRFCGQLIKGDCLVVQQSTACEQGAQTLVAKLGLRAPSSSTHAASTAVKEAPHQSQLPQQQCGASSATAPSSQPQTPPPTVQAPCLQPLSIREQVLSTHTQQPQLNDTSTQQQPPSSLTEPQPQLQQHTPTLLEPAAPEHFDNSTPRSSFDLQAPQVPCWTDLPPEIMSLIYQALPKECSASLALMQTCQAFRKVALDCPHILTRMWFNLPDVRQPLKKSPTPASLRINPITANHHSCKALSSCKASNASQSTPAANNCIRRLLPMQHLEEGRSNTSSAAQILDLACARLHEPAGNLATSAATNARGSKRVTGGPQWALHSGTVKPQAAWAGMSSLPAPLARAAHHGNPSACGLIAQLLEVNGYTNDCEVLLYWRRSAKYGDVEAMLKLGFALYEGTCGCAVDVDAAHSWLSKAVRSLLGGVASLSQISVDLTECTITISGSATHVVAAAAGKRASPTRGDLSSSPTTPSAWMSPSSSHTAPCSVLGASSSFADQQHDAVLTDGGPVVPGKPYTAPLSELLKVGCSADQKAAAAVAAEMATAAASAPDVVPKRRKWPSSSVLQGDEDGQGDDAEGQQQMTSQERIKARALEQRQQRQRMHKEEMLLAQRKLQRMQGHTEVPRVDANDPSLLPLLARAAELLGYMNFDGEGSIKADQSQACVLFKLATLAGSREAARVLGWIYSTGQYGS